MAKRALMVTAVLLALAPTIARAATQTRDDPSDAPSGASGEADLRTIAWDVGSTTATLTVAIDESTYGASSRADIGVHVLLDTDGDGIADHQIVAKRNLDGAHVDVALRTLDRTQSTPDCQDLDGSPTSQSGTVATTVANGLETFAFTFDPAVVPGGLAAFRWAAFGQAPDAAATGPWDVMPDAANPDPGAPNPGDRSCDMSSSGLSVRMSEGAAFPDPPDVAPTAVADDARIFEDAGATPIPVLANDTDPDGGPKRVEAVTQPAYGTVVITNAGADLTYEPGAPACDLDPFTYTLNGGSTATVSVMVLCAGDPAFDGTAPETSITKHPKPTLKTRKRKATAVFEFASAESDASFVCRIDHDFYSACSSPASFKLKAGRHTFARHTFEVAAVDAAGNRDTSPARVLVKVVRKRRNR